MPPAAPIPRNLSNSPATETVCALCGLELPRNPRTAAVRERLYRFCCSGCRQVFIILSETLPQGTEFSESELYRTSLRMGIIGKPEAEPASIEPSPESLDGTQCLTLHIGGMWCSSCSWLIEKVVGSVPGVVHTRVLYASDTARIHFRPEMIGAESILQSVKRLGYSPSFRDGETDQRSKERTSLLVRMGLALFLMNNIMFFSYTMYIGYFQDLPMEITSLVPHIMFGLALPAVFWCGLPIHRKAFRSALALAPTMEVLFSIGILASFGYSVVTMLGGGAHYYFDTSAALVALFLVGKFIEQGAKRKASEDIHRLYELLPRKVRIICKAESGESSPGDERMIAIEDLRVGDRFLVKPGEKIPADGDVIEGKAVVDESLLTGESKPVEKLPGRQVVASSMNISGTLVIRAARIGDSTTLSNIIRMVESAFSNRSPLEQTVDRVTRVFIPAVLTIALSTGIALISMGYGAETALLRAITVLLIACPCALGMATPLAIAAGIGLAAKKGILIGDTSALQRLAGVNTVVFDKTGTITEGKFVLRGIIGHAHPEEALRIAAALEQFSGHPIALAVMDEARRRGIRTSEETPVPEVAPTGICGLIDGVPAAIGNQSFVAARGFSMDRSFAEAVERELDLGRTVVYVGSANFPSAVALVLGDAMATGSVEAVAELKRRGLGLHVVSGDGERTTTSIAVSAGIPNSRAQVLPHEKSEYAGRLQSQGLVVAMVGDGVNDAPALASADVGFAMGEGTEIAVATAPVTLLRNDLRLVPESITIAQRTMASVRQNLGWSFAYNAIGIVLAIAGLLNPLIGAGAMLASSISVIANSIRLRR